MTAGAAAGPSRASSGLLDHHFGAKLFLTDLEIVQGDATIRQILVECGKLLEQAGLIDRFTIGAAHLGTVSRSSIFARARSFLA